MIERTMSDGILTLRLAHGKVSALDIELLHALQDELVGAASASRAVILTGTGSIFSAGVDLFRLTREGPDYVRRFIPILCDFVRTLFAFPRPVVAAVNGHAIAGGCIMVLASDVRLMADGDGRIGVPELTVGVPFPAAPLEVVRFAVPRDKIQELVYTGKTVRPHEAITAGLIDHVVPSAELLARADEIARQLAEIEPDSYRLAKHYMRAQALDRIDRSSAHDRAALEIWSDQKTHQRIRDYLSRTLGK